MLEKLRNHLSKNFPFLKEKKLLLATSGGIDSMIMLDLFQKLNYTIASEPFEWSCWVMIPQD